MQETLNKLCCDTDPININHELYVLVRGIPTKSKIIWEQMIDIKKVFDALTWLKHNNPLYSHITLSNTHDELCLKKLNDSEFKMQAENDKEHIAEDEHKSLSDSKIEMRKTRDNVVLTNQHEAMVTQVIDDNNSYYEQYIRYILYMKKNQTKLQLLYIKC